MEANLNFITRARQAVLAISAGLAMVGGFLVFLSLERLYREYPAIPPIARYGLGMEALLYWA